VKVEWHPRARVDVIEAIEYIAAENLDAAYRVHDAIAGQIKLLARHPEMGRTGRVSGTRELVVVGTPYLAAYRITGKTVTILRVLHGARKWPKRL
jgi:toxin ParE1/3/4